MGNTPAGPQAGATRYFSRRFKADRHLCPDRHDAGLGPYVKPTLAQIHDAALKRSKPGTAHHSLQ